MLALIGNLLAGLIKKKWHNIWIEAYTVLFNKLRSAETFSSICGPPMVFLNKVALSQYEFETPALDNSVIGV